MMREDQVHSSSVNIEVLAQILASHGGTFGMPSGETVAPWRRPAHDVFRLRFFPEGEVGGITFFALSVEVAGGIQYVVEVAAGEFAVMIVLIIFSYVKVDGTFAFVSVSGVQNLLYELDLFDNVTRSVRLDAGRKYIQCFHCLMIAVQVILNDFHRLQFFETGFLGYFVFSFVSIMLQMTDIGNIAYIAYFIS